MLRTKAWLWVASLVTACFLGFSQGGLLRADEAKGSDEAKGFPGNKWEWNGYDRYDFPVNGRECLVVVPKKAAPQNPWIWRTEFFG